jgi:hypothetical protein
LIGRTEVNALPSKIDEVDRKSKGEFSVTTAQAVKLFSGKDIAPEKGGNDLTEDRPRKS